MTRPSVLPPHDIDAWLGAHPNWSRDRGDAIVRNYTFPDFAAALAFVVRVGLFAERTDHHPDLTVGWGKASVRFSTHEPSGITTLDIEGAEAADKAYGG